MAIITLLTDFGTADGYIAEVKGVLLTLAPGAVLVDVSHHVPPGVVQTAQYLLSRSWRRFPADTVHLAVVDPAVGTARRALAGEVAGHRFVAPDNGLLSVLPREARFVALPVPAAASPTFHARDVFAPAAALLAMGTPLEQLGPPLADPYLSPLPTPSEEDGQAVGEVLHVDRFGNLISNIPGDSLVSGARIVVEGTEIGGVSRTFGEVERGKLLAYVGSGGTVEVGVRDGSAARLLGVGVGAEVRMLGGVERRAGLERRRAADDSQAP